MRCIWDRLSRRASEASNLSQFASMVPPEAQVERPSAATGCLPSRAASREKHRSCNRKRSKSQNGCRTAWIFPDGIFQHAGAPAQRGQRGNGALGELTAEIIGALAGIPQRCRALLRQGGTESRQVPPQGRNLFMDVTGRLVVREKCHGRLRVIMVGKMRQERAGNGLVPRGSQA